MNGFVEKLNKVLEVILGMIGIAMILIQTYAVFARNVLQVASPWSDEALKLVPPVIMSLEQALDVEAMRQAADRLTGIHDFRAFSSYRRTKKSTVRTLEEISIEREGEEIRLRFTGNGFLYHMVRILTGTLIEVGLHKKKPEDMERILASLDRQNAGFTAPAQGLFLVNVEY